jgi:hypothetical protein
MCPYLTKNGLSYYRSFDTADFPLDAYATLNYNYKGNAQNTTIADSKKLLDFHTGRDTNKENLFSKPHQQAMSSLKAPK